jgi:hypothetical protein
MTQTPPRERKPLTLAVSVMPRMDRHKASQRIAKRASEMFAQLQSGAEESHLYVRFRQLERVTGFLNRHSLHIS